MKLDTLVNGVVLIAVNNYILSKKKKIKEEKEKQTGQTLDVTIMVDN